MLTYDHRRALRRVMLGAYPPVAFIGSGLSTNYPLWPTFLAQLANYVGHRNGKAYFAKLGDSAGDLDVMLAIADECAQKSEQVAGFIRRLFLNTSRRADRPPVFNSLVRAPFAYYVTTNYDTNIEDAYHEQYGVDMNVATLDNIDVVFNFILEGKPFLLKLHGCAKGGQHLIIGYRDYQNIIFGDPKVRAVLELVLGSRPVVFMGYGHRDPHISSYLDYQRQRLRDRALPKFTYVKVDMHPFDISEYYARRYYIDSVHIHGWDQLRSELDQYAYLQMRDRCERIRQNKARLFTDFVTSANRSRAWDAVLYAAASSELGMTQEVRILWEKVENSQDHASVFACDLALALIFHTIAGQMLKRRGQNSQAANEFKKAEAIAKRDRELLPPLRALALRYAGIFALEQKHAAKAWSLFVASKKILDEDQFEEELLDVRKWMALYRARVRREYKEASEELISLAQEANDLGYRKNAAWCRYNAAQESMHAGATAMPIRRVRDLAEAALATFEELNQLQGRAYCYLLLARLIKDSDPEQFRWYMRLAQAAAVLAEDERLQKRCQEVDQNDEGAG